MGQLTTEVVGSSACGEAAFHVRIGYQAAVSLLLIGPLPAFASINSDVAVFTKVQNACSDGWDAVYNHPGVLVRFQVHQYDAQHSPADSSGHAEVSSRRIWLSLL